MGECDFDVSLGAHAVEATVEIATAEAVGKLCAMFTTTHQWYDPLPTSPADAGILNGTSWVSTFKASLSLWWFFALLVCPRVSFQPSPLVSPNCSFGASQCVDASSTSTSLRGKTVLSSILLKIFDCT